MSKTGPSCKNSQLSCKHYKVYYLRKKCWDKWQGSGEAVNKTQTMQNVDMSECGAIALGGRYGTLPVL